MSLDKLGMVQTLVHEELYRGQGDPDGKENMIYAQKVKSKVFFYSREVSCKVNFDAGNFGMRKINEI